MIEGLVPLAIGILLSIGGPYLLVRSKRTGRGRKGMGLAGGGLAGVFDVFDPARARAQQAIEIRQEIGDADEGDRGEKTRGG